MSGSLAHRLARGSAALLVVTLVIVGAGTAAVLHTRAVRALDAVLLSAAHGRAHPDPRARVEVEHSRAPVDTWLVEVGDPRVPEALRDEAMRGEQPLFTELGDERLVLLPFEVEDRHHESFRLAAAAAPRVTLAHSVGPFALSYALLAALAAGLATLLQLRFVRRAFGPVDRARDEVARVMGLGGGQRVTESGPVEIRSLLEAINGLLSRLEDAHQAQTRFTAEAAHELRTPVTSMLGTLDVALRSPRPPEAYRDVLASTREDVARLRRLVEGLVALARIDAGQVDQGREPVRAGELVDAAASAEQKTLEEAGCALRIEVDDDPELEAHRPLLEVALANLLRNAARHAPGCEVVLRVGREADLAVFEVDDAGPGVPPDEREALFDRFTRTGEARRRDRAGLGLGLPIAREVARHHGGDCVLADSPTLGGLRARLTVATPRPPLHTDRHPPPGPRSH